MYLVFLTVAGAACALLAAGAWRNRRYPGFACLAVMEAAVAWWVFCYLGEQLDPDRARLWFALKFLAVGMIPPSWLLFAMNQVGERPRLRAWWPAFAWPAILGPLALTNDRHHLFFTDVVQRQELVGLDGPLFPFHLALSYTFLLGAAGLLLRDWRQRRQVPSGVLFLGALIPFATSVMNEFVKTMPGVDQFLLLNPTLPSVAASSVFIGWTAMRYRLLDPRPVARDALFESLLEVVLVLNEKDVVVDANRAAGELLGRPERDLLGLAWTALFPAPEWHPIPHGDANVTEREWARAGGPRWLEVQRNRLTDPAGRSLGLLVVIRDVTTRKTFELELRAQSYRDELTGLSNRRYLDDEAARLQASREFPVAIFAFDLDGLKQVNDRYGHAAGDGLLQSMAQFLQQFFRAGDRVIRQGGDEFLVLLPATGADEAERIRTRLTASLASFNGERGLGLRFSTGVSVIADAADWAPGVKRADERLYEAKRNAVAAQR